MSVKAVLEKLRGALDAVGIPYFVTGSFASSAHGVPRSTNDIDVVIAPSLFNIVDYSTMWKIDFIAS